MPDLEKFRKKYLVQLFAGRSAEDAAEALPDDSPERADLLSVSENVEDWFRVESNRPGQRTLTSPRPDDAEPSRRASARSEHLNET